MPLIAILIDYCKKLYNWQESLKLCKYSETLHSLSRVPSHPIRAFFYKQRFFFLTRPLCCLTFSWIELQLLLRCCLIHISTIILRHFLKLGPCLGLYLFASYLWDLFLIFIFIFIIINHNTISLHVMNKLFNEVTFRQILLPSSGT